MADNRTGVQTSFANFGATDPTLANVASAYGENNGQTANLGSSMQSTPNSDTDPYMRRNTKNFKELSYFIAGIDVTDQNLDQLTPYIPGIARLFMHKEPIFMQIAFPTQTDNFKSYIETGYKSVQGINDLSASAETIQGGWANQSYEIITSVEDQTNEITIGLYEQTGSPVREFLELWITGIRDPRSGVAHYHGVVETPKHKTLNDGTAGTYAGYGGINGGMRNVFTYNDNGQLEQQFDDEGKAKTELARSAMYVPYGEKYHTAEFVYYDLDPTAHYIEYACMFAHAFPKSVNKDQYNYNSGERSPIEVSVPFSVMKYESRYINDLAVRYLIKDQLEYNYLNFDPLFKKNGLKHQHATDDDINYDLALDQSTAGTATT